MSGRMFRPPETYMVDGAAVVVPARVAAFLVRRLDLARLRAQLRGADAELDGVLIALTVTAQRWRADRVPGNGTGPAGSEEQTAALEPRLTTGQVGALLGIGDRAVRQAISRGRLPASREGGRWAIHRDDVEHYRAAQEAA